MKDNNNTIKKQVVKEIFGSEYEEEFADKPQQSVPQGTYTKPMITQNLVEAFDSFRVGMDKLVNIYDLMSKSDPELHRKISRFGETMTKMMEGLAKVIEQQGGSVESVTKPAALQTYFGNQGMSALGMNENKQEVFDAKVDLQVSRIKHIMESNKR